jgi:hypothetical protein
MRGTASMKLAFDPNRFFIPMFHLAIIANSGQKH